MCKWSISTCLQLKEHVHEAMVVMDEICASKETREGSGQQVQANGTEKAESGHSPTSFSTSTPGGATGVSSEPSKVDTVAPRAALELGILRNGSASKTASFFSCFERFEKTVEVLSFGYMCA